MLLLLSTIFVAANAFVIVPPQHLDTYVDTFARTKILPLDSAAYSTDPAKCLSNKFGNAQVTWVAGGKVSKYFYNAFTAVWNGGMKDDVLYLINTYPNYKVWVTGHSLGGSMASLCASYILANNLVSASQMSLYTLGQPRTGNKDFASAHDAQFSAGTSYRLTHWRDMVPHVPPEGLEGYHHHASEVWYKENMKLGAPFVVCYDEEDKKCSDYLTVTLSIEDHLHYFETDISEWGEKGCL